jgi:DNA-binding CsgD family transcriptional regulator
VSALRTAPIVIGRELELARLRGPVAALAAGRGRAVLVSGEPGIGKSTLLAAAATQAAAAGVEVLRAGREAGSASCEALTELVERATGTHPDPRPTAIVFEDLHAADEGLLGLWRRLARASAHAPILLLGARRPVPRTTAVERLRRETAEQGGLLITLDALDPREVAALARVLTGAPPGPDLLEHLEAAGRNPRYIRELIEAAVARGALRLTDGLMELTEPEPPARLSGPIAQRLDFLAPRTLDVLRGAALLEAEFSVGDLALITSSTPVELVPTLDEAMAAGLVEPSGRLLRLRHPVIRRALYEATPPERRIAEHRRAAWVLTAAGAQPQRVARQLLYGAGSATEPWEADWLAANGEVLTRRDPEAAARLLELAVAGLAAEDPRRPLFEDLLADAEFRLFRYENAARFAAENASHSTDPERIGRNTWLRGSSLLRLRRLDELLRVLDEAAGRDEASQLWLTRYEALRSVALGSFGRMREARDGASAVLDAARESGDVTAIGYALHTLSLVAAVEDQDSTAAVALNDRAMSVVRTAPDLLDLRVMLWTHRFGISIESGDSTAELMDWARQMLVTAESGGSVRLGRMRLHVAEVAYELGLWDEARDGLLHKITDRELTSPATRYAVLAQIAARRDEGERAAELFEAMRRAEDARISGSPGFSRFFVLAGEALGYERARAPRAAVEVLALCLNDAQDRNPLRYRLLPTLARLALALGDTETAEAAANAAENDARRDPLVRRRAAALWCRGLVNGDPAAVSSAADLLRAAELKSVLGNALEDAAELLARAGEPERARDTLLEALATYEELGAAWDTRRALSRLHAHGVRIRANAKGRAAASGPDALTPTQLRVAELVAEGYSNPEIAERLNLSRRTVESHVSHILAKLRVSSRGEIRAHLPPAAP